MGLERRVLVLSNSQRRSQRQRSPKLKRNPKLRRLPSPRQPRSQPLRKLLLRSELIYFDSFLFISHVFILLLLINHHRENYATSSSNSSDLSCTNNLFRNKL